MCLVQVLCKTAFSPKSWSTTLVRESLHSSRYSHTCVPVTSGRIVRTTFDAVTNGARENGSSGSIPRDANKENSILSPAPVVYTLTVRSRDHETQDETWLKRLAQTRKYPINPCEIGNRGIHCCSRDCVSCSPAAPILHFEKVAQCHVEP